MSHADDIAAAAHRIQHRLTDGRWHDAIDLTASGDPWQVTYDALNHLMREEAIEFDARRRVYRLVPPAVARQTTIYDQEA